MDLTRITFKKVWLCSWACESNVCMRCIRNHLNPIWSLTCMQHCHTPTTQVCNISSVLRLINQHPKSTFTAFSRDQMGFDLYRQLRLLACKVLASISLLKKMLGYFYKMGWINSVQQSICLHDNYSKATATPPTPNYKRVLQTHALTPEGSRCRYPDSSPSPA